MAAGGESQIAFRRLTPADTDALCAFYNALSAKSKTLFNPLGDQTTTGRCEEIAAENLPEKDTQWDVVAVLAGRVVGWVFLWDFERPHEATFGLGVADDRQSRGVGTRLMAHAMEAAAARGLRKVHLTVFARNAHARKIYEAAGFRFTGSFRDDEKVLRYRMVRELGEYENRDGRTVPGSPNGRTQSEDSR